jgi:hypothetical protein
MPVICLALDRRPGARSFRQTDFSAVDGNNIIQCVSYKAQQNIRVTRGKVVASIGHTVAVFLSMSTRSRRQCLEVFRVHARLPLWFVQHLLDH